MQDYESLIASFLTAAEKTIPVTEVFLLKMTSPPSLARKQAAVAVSFIFSGAKVILRGGLAQESSALS